MGRMHGVMVVTLCYVTNAQLGGYYRNEYKQIE